MLKTKKIEKANTVALRYFTAQFKKSKKAKAYTYDRISQATTKKFYLGYGGTTGLVEYLNDNGISEPIAKESGLVTLDYDGNALNRFSGRLIFPIIHAGRLAGFGGRTLTDVTKKNPKYINSKTSALYNKSDILYGVWRARKSIMRKGYGFLVEGYFDVLGLYDVGVKNSVAACGTGITREHARILGRYAEKMFIMLDGDSAGQEAAAKAKKLLKKERIYG